MEDERQTPGEQSPSLDPQSAEIARLLKQEQEHLTEIAQWQKKSAQLEEEKSAQLEQKSAQLEEKSAQLEEITAQLKEITAQLEEKAAQLEEELAQLKKTTSGAGKIQGDEATPRSPQQPNLAPRERRRRSAVENLAGEYGRHILSTI